MNSAVVRKKTGFPDDALTTDPLHLQCYTPLCKYLNETRKLAVTEQILSQFAYNILYFMETQFGKQQTAGSADRKKMVKLPYSIFRDFRISGGMCTVFEISAKHANISSWVTTNHLADAKNVESGIQLLLDVERGLVQNGLIRRPVFCFGNSIHEQPQGTQLVRELTDIVLSHGGSLTEDCQKASFVVLWDEEVDGTLDGELQEEYIRPLEIRPNQDNGVALVHWWYHPDSYDEWIPSQDVQYTDTPEDTYMQLYQQTGYYQPTQQPVATAYVCCRYLRDVQEFNEWGNLLDYEMDKPFEGSTTVAESDAVGASTRKSRGKKRSIDRRQLSIQRQQQNGIQQNSFVAQAVSVTEKMLQDLPPPTLHDTGSQFSRDSNLQAVNVVDIMANQPCSLKVETPLNVTRDVAELKESQDVDPSSMEVSNEGGGDELQHAKTTNKRKRDEDETILSYPTSLADNAVLKKDLSNGTGDMVHLLPGSQLPPWFHTETISSVEMKYIPELVLSDGSDQVLHAKEYNTDQQMHDAAFAMTQKSGQKYLGIRNSIVHLYHQNVQTFLTATECRRKIAGDVAFIIRVHEFLDAFGVINYNPEIKVTFRNPKSSIFYSTCPGRSSSSTQVKTEDGAKQSMWNKQLDQSLMQAVTTVLESGNASLNEAVHEVGGVNWHQVASIVASQVAEQKRVQFTSVACLVRFTEMSLVNAPGVSSAEAVVPGGGSSISSRVEKYVASAPPASKHVRALASVVTSAAADLLLDVPQVQAVARAIQNALQGSSSQVSPTAVAALGTGAVLVSSAAQAAAKNKVAQAETYLNDYISLRLSVLEKKMELVGDIEDALLLERGRAELDRHDLQVQRAQHASSVALTGDSMARMGGGMY